MAKSRKALQEEEKQLKAQIKEEEKHIIYLRRRMRIADSKARMLRRLIREQGLTPVA